jgi:hypothetical protein
MFWIGVGLLGFFALVVVYLVLGVGLTTAWGLTFLAAEKRYGMGMITAGNLGIGVVWLCVSGIWCWSVGGDLTTTAWFAGLLGIFCFVSCPR